MKNFLITLSILYTSVVTTFAQDAETASSTGKFLRYGAGMMRNGFRDDVRDGYAGPMFGHMYGYGFSWAGLGFMVLHFICMIAFIAIAVYVARIAWDKAGKCCNNTPKK